MVKQSLMHHQAQPISHIPSESLPVELAELSTNPSIVEIGSNVLVELWGGRKKYEDVDEAIKHWNLD